MLVGSREFVADDQGRIVLPPAADLVTRRAIISDGKLSRQVNFAHLQEQYSLTAAMHLDRTQLQSGGSAALLIRPRLKMGDTPIDPQTLQEISVLIEARDLESLTTSKHVDGLKLSQSGELMVPFRVPPRLAGLTVTLSGKIDGLSNSQEQTLRTSRSWNVAGIRQTSHTHDAFLTRDGDEYVIEVRGRSGEPVSGAVVNVSLVTTVRDAPVEQMLQCNEQGQVRLSKLSGIQQIRFGIPSGLQHTRELKLDYVDWPDEIHTTTDRAIRLPLASLPQDLKSKYRLIELRDRSHHADRSERLSVDAGLLVIDSLLPGDYQLLDRTDGSRITIAVVDGPLISSVAVGRVRHRSISPVVPLGIESIDRDEAGLNIKLAGNTELARVHVYASRYIDSALPAEQLQLPLPRLYGRRISLPRCGYVSDLRLGDEYQYVLRRRYAKKYPGVMLPQPSVILNPWETEKTTNRSQSARGGDVPPPSAAAPSNAAAMNARENDRQRAQMTSSDYDFLADPGAAVFNLRPDADGIVTVSGDVLEGLPVIQIVVCDPATTLQRTVTSPLQDTQTVDLRLAKALDANKAFSFERTVSVVSKDSPLELENLGSAQLQVYASVGALMKLYKTLVKDPRLADFDELASWHTLDQPAKLDAYTRLASHELHLFLWAHDRGFFEEIIQPYLANKQEKQLIDHWLLGNDLSEYATLWRYNQLNAAERVLLSMRLPDVREAVLRDLKEHVAKQDEDFEELRRTIESALQGDSMEVDFDDSLRANLSLSMADESGTESLFGAVRSSRGIPRATRRKEAAKALEKKIGQLDSKLESNRFMLFSGRGKLGGGANAFYRELDSTKQWAESNWDRVRTVGGPPPSTLISTNAFWSDLASAGEGVHVSSHLLRPTDNRHSALLALALCGLPLTAGDVGLPTEPDQAYAPEHAVAVVTKRLKSLQDPNEESSILIGQRFDWLDDAGRQSSPSDIVSEPQEFLIGVAYQGQTVVSNPTAAKRVVDVFWQIPAGSLPLAASQVTDSRTLVLEPFAVQAIEYQFYFPQAGEFDHYPATVSADGNLLARGSEKTFTVVSRPTEQNTVTWEKMARTGTPEQLRDFLGQANLRQLDWMLIAHRMADQDVYQVVTGVLRDARLPILPLLGYSFKHRDEPGMKDFLSLQDDLVQQAGPVLASPLLEIDPIVRRRHELLEYAPLVRARIHRLGEQNEILNPTFLRQYRSFVEILGYTQEIADSDQLVLAYYLLLQNRIEEAIAAFAKVDRDDVESKLQYDYVDAYLALHQEHFDRADRLAAKYTAHPIPRWQNRFGQLAAQLNQRRSLHRTERLVSVDKEARDPITEGSGDLSVIDRQQRQQLASQEQPEVIVRVEGNSLRIDHRRAEEVTINLYGVDLELLFSKAPFAREDLQRMAMVRPSRTEQVQFDAPTGVGRYELDDNLSRQTLLVEAVAGAARSTALYYGGEITTYVSESYGQLQTTDATSHRPISTAYVKVYARYPDGSVRFYKDGYTDARGRFDYASISADDAKGATRFAILVISEEKGATLHDVATPTQ
ncbi:MAG: hypothetical protein MI861_23630 [Pirellulales bacterium]|nr:hypothetical protein [Pirellulales bacterium]